MDEIWKRDEVESPCVSQCGIHPRAGICVGCFRTASEIENWTAMGQESRKALMVELPDREKLLRFRRKKRARS